MAQIQNKFIATNAVDDQKIRLPNAAYLRGRNQANSSDVNILRINTSNAIEFASVPQVLSDPVNANDLTRKSYVDNLLQGVSWKNFARIIATAALDANTYANGTAGEGATLTSNVNEAFPAIDGVTLALNDRIVVAGEATASHNGIYFLSIVGSGSAPWVLTRSLDADDPSELVSAAVFIDEGTANAGTAWVQTVAAPITIGTTSLTFAKFSTTTAVTYRNGLTQTGSIVDVTPGDNSLTATTGSLIVKEDAAGAIVTGGSGIKVQLESSNPTLQITSNQLGVKLSGTGAIVTSASGITLQVDNSTVEINANTLRVKDAGITLAKLASNSVDENKIVSTAISATGGLNGGSGTKISIRVDAVTVKINGSNNLEGLKHLEQKITLVSGDITNQFVDLAHAIWGVDATNNSASVYVVGGVMQEKAVDYTVSLTGGSGGVTRITFAGDLATGGNAALVSGDKIVIMYDYLT